MKENVLSRVIEVEKRVQEKLQEERLKAGTWLEEAKKKAEEHLRYEEEKIRAGYAGVVGRIKEEAENKAGEILADAVRVSQGYAEIKDGVIDEVVLKHITVILPEE